ncbi:MAG: deoxyhypusine synthase family protein [bacterium]
MPKRKKPDLKLELPGYTPPDARKKRGVLHTPITPLKLTPDMTVADLVEGFRGMSVQARNLGLCGEVLKNMLTDRSRPTVLMGLAGPLVAAGLRAVLRDMIEHNLVDVIVSTGAILYQDIYQARGFHHFVGSPHADDARLRQLYIDRIYDTYVDEEKFIETDDWLGRVADDLPPGNTSSRAYMDSVADRLNDPDSIVVTARKRGVPMFVPAINDSSIGIGLTDHYHRAKVEGRPHLTIDSIRDNYELTQIVVKSKATAAIYVAGGVPKNYINDSVVMSYIFGAERGHTYALQVTTAVPMDGGLSGSTLSEAVSWGKIRTKARTAMAWVEPSVALPLLVGYAIQRDLGANRGRLKFHWDQDVLKRIELLN